MIYIDIFLFISRFWPRKGCAEKLLSTNLCPLQTRIVVDRNPKTGQLLGFKEVNIAERIFSLNCRFAA